MDSDMESKIVEMHTILVRLEPKVDRINGDITDHQERLGRNDERLKNLERVGWADRVVYSMLAVIASFLGIKN